MVLILLGMGQTAITELALHVLCVVTLAADAVLLYCHLTAYNNSSNSLTDSLTLSHSLVHISDQNQLSSTTCSSHTLALHLNTLTLLLNSHLPPPIHTSPIT